MRAAPQRQATAQAAGRACRSCSSPFPVRRQPLVAGAAAAGAAAQQQQPLPERVQLPGIDDAIALTPEPLPGSGLLEPPAPWVRPAARTVTGPSVRDSGTLRPGPEWFPAWMQYRRREDNYTFWQDKFLRCSLEIPAAEKRWTVFSSLWWLVMEFKYFGVPPALRYLFYLAWRGVLQRAYEAHKAVVLWQAKVDAALAARAVQQRAPGADTGASSSGGSGDGGAAEASGSGASSSGSGDGGGGSGLAGDGGPGFSRAMALRRLHWKNSLLGELLYLINVAKTGRVHMLPPPKRPPQRPTFFFLF